VGARVGALQPTTSAKTSNTEPAKINHFFISFLLDYFLTITITLPNTYEQNLIIYHLLFLATDKPVWKSPQSDTHPRPPILSATPPDSHPHLSNQLHPETLPFDVI
jgi:hypothetical protein